MCWKRGNNSRQGDLSETEEAIASRIANDYWNVKLVLYLLIPPFDDLLVLYVSFMVLLTQEYIHNSWFFIPFSVLEDMNCESISVLGFWGSNQLSLFTIFCEIVKMTQ